MYDIELIKELLTTAGERSMTYFGKVTPTLKENQTYVTEADIDVQEYLKTELGRRFPDDGMIGEENNLSQEPRSGDRYWIIDPIDGTASFARGFPIWGIAVGLFSRTQALGGFFYLPTTRDFFHTKPDGTVWRNEQRVELAAPDPLSREAVLLAWPKWQRSYTISREYSGRIRSLGSTIAHLCYVAAGNADAAFIETCPIWDLAAGLTMLLNNQGVLEYLDGTPVAIEELVRNRKTSQHMLAGHPEAVQHYRQLLSKRM